ncbi:MAG TPA: hypothetical protein PKL09_03485 [bacterium]|nr:hypothetical protein [bacterium]HNS34350.1 hypothetical protein [bacterium]HNZ73545.1 hypothetical protein [bacterium]HOH67545.1 hypothetical protein [bacterium]HQA63534.1 hypothetical protein [bacterium]
MSLFKFIGFSQTVSATAPKIDPQQRGTIIPFPATKVASGPTRPIISLEQAVIQEIISEIGLTNVVTEAIFAKMMSRLTSAGITTVLAAMNDGQLSQYRQFFRQYYCGKK